MHMPNVSQVTEQHSNLLPTKEFKRGKEVLTELKLGEGDTMKPDNL